MRLLKTSLFTFATIVACDSDDSVANPFKSQNTRDAGGDGSVLDAGRTFAGPLWRSGTRLRALVATTASGEKFQTGWYDTVLKTECGFSQLTDGKIRCAPLGNLTRTAFADAACSQTVLIAKKGDTTPAYVSNVAPGCSGNRLRTKGAERAVTNLYFFDGKQGTCFAIPANPTTESYFDAVDVDNSKLVDAVPTVSTVSSRLGIKFYNAIDGAISLASLADLRRSNAACDPDRAVSACIPVAKAEVVAGRFTDSTCTSFLAKASLLSGYPKDVCADTPRVIRNASQYYEAIPNQASTVFSLTGGSCASQPRPEGSLFSRGAALLPAAFAATEFAVKGTGVVRVTHILHDGIQVAAAGLFDSVENKPCNIVETSVGTRCVTDDTLGQYQQFYADAACSQPIATAPPSKALSGTRAYWQRPSTPGKFIVDPGTIGAKRMAPAAVFEVREATTGSSCVDFGSVPGFVEYYDSVFAIPTEAVSYGPE